MATVRGALTNSNSIKISPFEDFKKAKIPSCNFTFSPLTFIPPPGFAPQEIIKIAIKANTAIFFIIIYIESFTKLFRECEGNKRAGLKEELYLNHLQGHELDAPG